MTKIFIKKTLCFVLTLLTFMTLVCLPNSFAQFGSPEYVVRVVYFLPNDQPPQPDINENLDRLIKDTQLFFADQMTAHGFNRKTFRFEADTAGNLVVHRVDGEFNDLYYQSNSWGKVWQEIERRFDLSNNIWLTALDISTEVIDNSWCGLGWGSSVHGRALMPASGGCFNVSVAGHELGHTFGLMHDNRVNGRWVVSVHTRTQPDRMITSFCSAEWLDVHRYFEINHSLSRDQPIAVETLDPTLISSSPAAPLDVSHLCGVGVHDVPEYFKVNETVPADDPPAFEMLGPPSLVALPNAIQLRFRVVDGDGLHQVRLHTPEWNPYVAGEFIACQRVNRTNAIVEFVTTELSPKSESVHLWTVDMQGNFGWSQSYPINITNLLPRATAVSIPDRQLAAAVRKQIGNITTRSLLNLRVVDGSNHTGITDLTGLEYAYNLKYVYSVFDGEITDVSPLENLVGLTGLALQVHQIRDINPLANLTNLTDLNLEYNNISDISTLANLKNLKYLQLSRNNTSDISALANLKNLIDLSLWNNNISDISALANLKNLKYLQLSRNNISDISALANLKNLKYLHLWDNNISDISAVENLTNLRYLSLGGNNISDILPLIGLTNLTHLHLPGNNISDIDTLARIMAQGTVVYFRGNPAFETPGPEIEEGWVWLIVPAMNVRHGTDAARSGRDFLSEASGGKLTEADVAVNGARAGTQVGNYVWTSATLNTADRDNLNTLVHTHNLGTDITYPVAYGVVPIQSETQQQTRVYIGGGPVKVWLNGILVYKDTHHRGVDFYETAVPVQLVPGNNLLFVSAYRQYPGGQWGAFFGFQDGTGYTIGAPEPPTGPGSLDVNADGQVNVIDLAIVALFYGTQVPDGGSLPADVNADGSVNILDLTAVAHGIDTQTSTNGLSLDDVEAALEAAANLEAVAEAPARFGNPSQHLRRIIYHNVAEAISESRHLGHSVHAVLKELLQLLTEMAEIPETTALFPNYPNPFNPETWIPYHLATDADVTVTIYDVRGVLVRVLALGHQAAGVYQSKHRAAYWDGRNENGESVASGVYFYTLKAGDFAATRKLIIRK